MYTLIFNSYLTASYYPPEPRKWIYLVNKREGPNVFLTKWRFTGRLYEDFLLILLLIYERHEKNTGVSGSRA